MQHHSSNQEAIKAAMSSSKRLGGGTMTEAAHKHIVKRDENITVALSL